MTNEKNGNENQPKRDQGFKYILSFFILIASLITGAVPSKTNAECNTNNTDNEIAKWTRVVGRWTRGLVIVGVITIGVLAGQGYILWTTDQTSRDINRAFVYFETIGLFPYPEKQPVVVTVIAIAINSGNTPARNIAFRFDCPDKATIGNRDPFEAAKLNLVFDPPTFLGPKQTVPLVVCQLKPNYADDILNNVNPLYVAAKTTYTDVFEPAKTRVTEMTRNIRADPFGGRSFGYVGKHNCADNDCQK